MSFLKAQKTGDVLTFGQALDDLDFEGSNKQVNKLVSDYIQKQKIN